MLDELEGIAGEIRAEAARQRLTQAALARRTGRSIGWVADRLHERRPLTPDAVRAFSSALHLPAGELARRVLEREAWRREM